MLWSNHQEYVWYLQNVTEIDEELFLFQPKAALLTLTQTADCCLWDLAAYLFLKVMKNKMREQDGVSNSWNNQRATG